MSKEERCIYIKDLDTNSHYKFLFTIKNGEIYLDVLDIWMGEKKILEDFKFNSSSKKSLLEFFKRIDQAKISNILPDQRLISDLGINTLILSTIDENESIEDLIGLHCF